MITFDKLPEEPKIKQENKLKNNSSLKCKLHIHLAFLRIYHIKFSHIFIRFPQKRNYK